MSTRRANIMLVEDSESDQIIVRRVLEDGNIKCELTVAENGQEALDLMLKGDDIFTPDLILMDINMPVMDGKETLRSIRSEPRIAHVPVVMLTTSSRDRDVMESYQLGVNAYLTKPVDDLEFINTVRGLEAFWFELVTLPPKSKR